MSFQSHPGPCAWATCSWYGASQEYMGCVSRDSGGKGPAEDWFIRGWVNSPSAVNVKKPSHENLQQLSSTLNVISSLFPSSFPLPSLLSSVPFHNPDPLLRSSLQRCKCLKRKTKSMCVASQTSYPIFVRNQIEIRYKILKSSCVPEKLLLS